MGTAMSLCFLINKDNATVNHNIPKGHLDFGLELHLTCLKGEQ